jgi:HTH-type transcriptional repressor of NAD biosynthesis genes
MTTRGLTLGKFAPLHKGHQFLIETALAEMDEVIVMVYDCPETIAVPLSVRAAWIRQLYPTVRVIEAWDGPTEIGDTPQIKAMKGQSYFRHCLPIDNLKHSRLLGILPKSSIQDWMWGQKFSLCRTISLGKLCCFGRMAV